MTTLYKTMLGFGILVIVGLLFAVLLLAVRKGQKPSPRGESREFSSSAVCPKCGTALTNEAKSCPKCGAPVG
jgi:rubrerythrin